MDESRVMTSQGAHWQLFPHNYSYANTLGKIVSHICIHDTTTELVDIILFIN